MITDYFLQLAAQFIAWIATLWPDFEVPQWMLDARPSLITLMESFNGLGAWVDWDVLGICIAAVASVYGIALLIRVIRAAVAHIPQFGGGGA